MILASHTVDCHARTLCSLAMTHPLPPEHREGAESHNNKNGRIGGATLVAHFVCDSCLSAVKTAPPKIPFVMLSVSETSLRFYIFRFCLFSYFLAILNVAFFFKGDRGTTCEASPYPPLTPNPCTLFFLASKTESKAALRELR